MAEHFDPYHKWLGIPLKDQPPNHYRLLGVDRFESDREVIDAAANRLMAYLQDLSTGDHADAAQRLLNQISAARLVLLSPNKKAAYDQQLREEAAAVPMARPVAPQSPPLANPSAPPSPAVASQPPASQPPAPNSPPAGPMAPTANSHPPAVDSPIVVADEPRGRRPGTPRTSAHTPRKQPSLIPIIVLGVAAIFIAAIAAYVLTRPDNRPSSQSNGGSAAANSTIVRINIPESQRSGVLVSLDGRKQQVPARGDIDFNASPGRTRVLIRRPGYRDISHELDLTAGVTTIFNPQFEEVKKEDQTQFDIPEEELEDLSNVQPPDEEK